MCGGSFLSKPEVVGDGGQAGIRWETAAPELSVCEVDIGPSAMGINKAVNRDF